jgi:hypothetical protein
VRSEEEEGEEEEEEEGEGEEEGEEEEEGRGRGRCEASCAINLQLDGCRLCAAWVEDLLCAARREGHQFRGGGVCVCGGG